VIYFLGVALDLVSLSKPPLFAVPLFSFMSHENSLFSNANDSQSLFGSGQKAVVGSVESMSLKNEFWDPLFYDQDYGGDERLFFFV
jgi:hypothetical protein